MMRPVLGQTVSAMPVALMQATMEAAAITPTQEAATMAQATTPVSEPCPAL